MSETEDLKAKAEAELQDWAERGRNSGRFPDYVLAPVILRLIAERDALRKACEKAEAALIVAIRAECRDSDFDAEEMAEIIDGNLVIVAIRAALTPETDNG